MTDSFATFTRMAGAAYLHAATLIVAVATCCMPDVVDDTDAGAVAVAVTGTAVDGTAVAGTHDLATATAHGLGTTASLMDIMALEHPCATASALASTTPSEHLNPMSILARQDSDARDETCKTALERATTTPLELESAATLEQASLTSHKSLAPLTPLKTISLTPLTTLQSLSLTPLTSLQSLSLVLPSAAPVVSSASRPVHSVAATLEHAKAYAFDCGARGDNKTDSASDDDDSETDSASEDGSEHAMEQWRSKCAQSSKSAFETVSACDTESESETESETESESESESESETPHAARMSVVHHVAHKTVIELMKKAIVNAAPAPITPTTLTITAATTTPPSPADADTDFDAPDASDADADADALDAITSLPSSIVTAAAPAPESRVVPTTTLPSKIPQPRARARLTTCRRPAAAPTAPKSLPHTQSLAAMREHKRRCRTATSKVLEYENTTSYLEKRTASLARREQLRSDSQRWH